MAEDELGDTSHNEDRDRRMTAGPYLQLIYPATVKTIPIFGRLIIFSDPIIPIRAV
jgi:hypothetical protein